MNETFIPMPDEGRKTIRRRVLDWARLQPSVPELSVGLLEGPGGEGADLIFFSHEGGSLIYLAESCGETIPPNYKGWVEQWKQSGAPVMDVVAAESEEEARAILLQQLSMFWLSVPQQVIH